MLYVYNCCKYNRKLLRSHSIRRKAAAKITFLAGHIHKMMSYSDKSYSNISKNLMNDEEKKDKSILTIHDVQFSDGYSRNQGMQDICGLLRSSEGGREGRWAISADARGIERSFKFKGFKKAWAFMNIVAAESVQKNHHPEWSNIYNTVFIRWTTHSPIGLSELDIKIAQYCDDQAKEFGEITTDNTREDLGVDKKLVDNIVDIARDCGTPKKSTVS